MGMGTHEVIRTSVKTWGVYEAEITMASGRTWVIRREDDESLILVDTTPSCASIKVMKPAQASEFKEEVHAAIAHANFVLI